MRVIECNPQQRFAFPASQQGSGGHPDVPWAGACLWDGECCAELLGGLRGDLAPIFRVRLNLKRQNIPGKGATQTGRFLKGRFFLGGAMVRDIRWGPCQAYATPNRRGNRLDHG
jgi:hypothetical protein